MTGVPAPTLYHRWLGWHAPAMRRAITVLIAGLIVAVVLLPFITWELALVGGWNATALTFLLTTWAIIFRADSSRAPQLAAREDQTEGSARVLLVGASVASLLGAGYALHLAGQKSGAPRMLLIGAAVLTVVLSWAVINTVYTLRYADQHFRSRPGGIAFGTEDGQQHPGYRDFAYVAFTIGMCYQVSDTTLRDPQIRRTVLAHAILSYVFGVVIMTAPPGRRPQARPRPGPHPAGSRGPWVGSRTDHRLTASLLLAVASVRVSSVRSGSSRTAPIRKQMAPIRVWVLARPALWTWPVTGLM